MNILSFQSFEMQISEEMVFSLPRKKYFSLEKPTQRSHNAHAREDQFSKNFGFGILTLL